MAWELVKPLTADFLAGYTVEIKAGKGHEYAIHTTVKSVDGRVKHGPIFVFAANRTQAADAARRNGFKVNSVNMIG
jgi:hypothetical protein